MILNLIILVFTIIYNKFFISNIYNYQIIIIFFSIKDIIIIIKIRNKFYIIKNLFIILFIKKN